VPLLPASARRPSPWKNGGGSTTEIAVSPEGAGLEDFDWRVSMARVERDGPFSTFPGIDRVLTIVDGVLILEVEGAAPVTLDASWPPHAFAGDVPAFGRLAGGAVVDLNVMTRRDGFSARVRRAELRSPLAFLSNCGDYLLIMLEGAADVFGVDGPGHMSAGDAWRVRDEHVRTLVPAPSARVLMVEFQSVSQGGAP
jgi:hypothetical protein